jgi:Tol biopolymer transport system component
MDNVVNNAILGVVAALADNGTLVYRTGSTVTQVDVVNDRGALVSTLPLEPRSLSSVNWSPDGTRVLLESAPFGASDLYVFDTLTRVTTRLTQDGRVQLPQWSPDGKRVAWIAPGKGRNMVVWMPADGSAPPEPVAAAKTGGGFTFSPDGKYIIVFSAYAGSGFNAPVTAFPLDGGTPIPLLAGLKMPGIPRVSPDGRWMLYHSDEGERREVYVRPFPSGPGRLQISTNGGDAPNWSRDGRRVFYRARGSFRVATLDTKGPLPRLVRDDSLLADVARRDFDVHPDGKRFALLRDAGEGAKLIVATHWLDEALARLKREQ